MQKVKTLFLLIVLFCIWTNPLKSQDNTFINLSVLDLSTLSLTNLLPLMEADLGDIDLSTLDYFRVTINSKLQQVNLNGQIDWDSPDGSFSGPIFSFITDPINLNESNPGSEFPYSISFGPSDMGDGKNVDIAESDDFGGDGVEKVAKIGKLSGIVNFSLFCTDPFTNQIISATVTEQIVFSNEVPTLSILSPSEFNNEVEQNGFPVEWDQTITSAESFIIVVRDAQFASHQEAFADGFNLNKEFDNMGGTLKFVQLTSTDFQRTLLPGNSYYLAVFAKVPDLGEGGFDYFAAGNNGMEIVVQDLSNLGKSTSGGSDPFGTDDRANLPSFTFIIPTPGNFETFDPLNDNKSIEWSAVEEAQTYEIVVTGLATSNDAQQVLGSVDNQNIIGDRLFSITTDKLNGSFSTADLGGNAVLSNYYAIAVGVFANHPSFGNIRSSDVIVYTIFTAPETYQPVANRQPRSPGEEPGGSLPMGAGQARDLIQLIGDGWNDVTAETEDGPMSGEQVKTLLEEIASGKKSGRVRVILGTGGK
jgi:hypothetical protein